MQKKEIVVLSGAGISAESGISTFRDHNGLWENHSIEEVASIEGFVKNPSLVLSFYNKRRAQLHEVIPNRAHKLLAELEKDFNVKIITQNVDDLHERAGSTQVLHLHGELRKVRPVNSLTEIIPWEKDLNLGDTDEKGVQLRPHIVWFGEEVLAIPKAIEWVKTANIFLIIGTSLQVYPAAGLVLHAPKDTPIFSINPEEKHFSIPIANHIQKTAVSGMEDFIQIIRK